MGQELMGSRISNKEIFRLIVDELAGVVLTDDLGRYMYVNNRWSAVTGLSFDEVRGKYVHDIMPHSQVDRVLQTGQYITKDICLRKAKTGEEIPIYCSYTPLYKHDDLIGCFIYMIIKGEDAPMPVPTNIEGLIDELGPYLIKIDDARRTKYSIDSIIGTSSAILRMKEKLRGAARSGSTVLIEGETGSGKELVAHAIHDLSTRSANPFIKVNCAAIPSELLESEFFGYEPGSFTGAKVGGKPGKFEMANNGSLFLDEINHMSMMLQPKFLRVLQENEIERIGSARSIPVNIRILVATNVPLAQMVEEGRFREDLFYRLNVIQVRVPPLRERKEDIPALTDDIIRQLNFQMGLQVPGIDPEATGRLMEYNWPGNVRELRNVIERAMNFAWCEALEWKHFEDYFGNQRLAGPAVDTAGSQGILRKTRTDAERSAVMEALQACGGNKAAAARMLGISRTALYKKMRRLQLQV